MKSFGRVLRRLRGSKPVDTVALQARVEPLYWMNVEASKVIPDVDTASALIERGFDLPKADCQRLILGVQLFDLGLRDNDLRQLFIDIVLGVTPPTVLEQVRTNYRSYAPE